MIKLFKKNQRQKKIRIYLLVAGFLILGLLSFFNNKFNALNVFNYNQEKKVFAADEKPLVCRKQTEIKFPIPIIPNVTIDIKTGPNEFEIPTGEVTDMTESVAERIMAELQKIIDASILEAASAGNMITLSSQCSISRCTTPGCNEYLCNPYNCNPRPCGGGTGTCYDTCWNTCCNKPSCGGQACPDGINNKLQEIIAQANIISNAHNEIRNILIERKPKKPVGFWWIPFCGFSFPGIPECLTEKDFILKELERSRSGNYQVFGGTEERPPGLEGCVIRPQDMEEVLKGEKTGKYLFSCKEAVAAGVIESNNCYGYNEATEQNRKRAENYYCCE